MNILNFLTLKPETFALDISDFSLKIIKLKKRGNSLTSASFLEEKIRPGLVKRGEIKDEDALAKIIKKSLSKVKGEKLKTNYVVASLPEEKSFLQVIQMPRIPPEDLKSAVVYEAENYIPLAIEDVYLDSQIVKPVFNHLDHYDVLIVAVPKKTADSYLNCLQKADLIPQAFETESLAIARAMIKKNMSPFPVLLVDMGASRTRFIIFSGFSIRFTTSIEVSAQKFTEIIAKNFKIDFKGAEKIKIKHGLTGDKKIFESLIPTITDLKEQIKKYILYYQTHSSHEHLAQEHKNVEKIILSGGGARLKGLVDFLSSELALPVEIGNPWVNILEDPPKEVPKIPFEESLKYTTVLGLALGAVRRNKDYNI